MLLPALHAYFRMYIAGQSLDLDDARALWAPLPLDDGRPAQDCGNTDADHVRDKAIAGAGSGRFAGSLVAPSPSASPPAINVMPLRAAAATIGRVVRL